MDTFDTWLDNLNKDFSKNKEKTVLDLLSKTTDVIQQLVKSIPDEYYQKIGNVSIGVAKSCISANRLFLEDKEY